MRALWGEERVWRLTGEVGGATPSPHLGGRGGGLLARPLELLTLDLVLLVLLVLPDRELLLSLGFLSTIFMLTLLTLLTAGTWT